MKNKTTAIVIAFLTLAAAYGVKAEPITCEAVVLTVPRGQLTDTLADHYRSHVEVRA